MLRTDGELLAQTRQEVGKDLPSQHTGLGAEQGSRGSAGNANRAAQCQLCTSAHQTNHYGFFFDFWGTPWAVLRDHHMKRWGWNLGKLRAKQMPYLPSLAPCTNLIITGLRATPGCSLDLFLEGFGDQTLAGYMQGKSPNSCIILKFPL